jgi:hypothetical protein
VILGFYVAFLFWPAGAHFLAGSLPKNINQHLSTLSTFINFCKQRSTPINRAPSPIASFVVIVVASLLGLGRPLKTATVSLPWARPPVNLVLAWFMVIAL